MPLKIDSYGLEPLLLSAPLVMNSELLSIAPLCHSNTHAKKEERSQPRQ